MVSEEALAGLTKLGFTQTMMSPGSSAQSGTQMYMAPELVGGKPASTRSDIYSLGVVLYQLLVGDFTRPVTIDWARDVADPFLREDLSNCFAGNPADRFAGAGQLAKNLRSLGERHRLKAEKAAADAARERATFRRGVRRGALVVVPLLVFIGLRLWQNVTPDVKVPQPKMPLANAYYFYRAAGASVQNTNALERIMMEDFSKDLGIFSLAPKGNELDSGLLGQIDGFLRDNAQVLTTVRLGFSYECRHPPIRSWQSEYDRDVFAFKRLENLLHLEGWRAQSRTNWAAASASYLDLIRLATELQQGAPFLQRLISFRMISRALLRFPSMLEHLNKTQAREPKNALDEIVSRYLSYGETLQEEQWPVQAALLENLKKADWRDESMKQATGDFSGKSSVTTWSVFFDDFKLHLARQLVSKRRLMELYTRGIQKWITLVKQPFHTGFSAPKLTYYETTFLGLGNWVLFGWMHHLFVRSQFDLLLVSLALRGYWLEQGKYPSSLSELVPDYIKEIPHDPFSDAAPLRYRREGQSYLLWSIGPDGRDDSGSFPPDGRYGELQTFKGDIGLMKLIKQTETSKPPGQQTYKMDPELLKRYGLLPPTNSVKPETPPTRK